MPASPTWNIRSPRSNWLDRDPEPCGLVHATAVPVMSPLPSGRTASVFIPPAAVLRYTRPLPKSGRADAFIPPWLTRHSSSPVDGS